MAVTFAVLTFANLQNFDRLREKQKLSLESFQMISTFTIRFLSRSSPQQISNFLLAQGIIFPVKMSTTMVEQRRKIKKETLAKMP